MPIGEPDKLWGKSLGLKTNQRLLGQNVYVSRASWPNEKFIHCVSNEPNSSAIYVHCTCPNIHLSTTKAQPNTTKSEQTTHPNIFYTPLQSIISPSLSLSFAQSLGRFTFSSFWLKLPAKVNVWRVLGRITPSIPELPKSFGPSLGFGLKDFVELVSTSLGSLKHSKFEKRVGAFHFSDFPTSASKMLEYLKQMTAGLFLCGLSEESKPADPSPLGQDLEVQKPFNLCFPQSHHKTSSLLHKLWRFETRVKPGSLLGFVLFIEFDSVLCFLLCLCFSFGFAMSLEPKPIWMRWMLIWTLWLNSSPRIKVLGPTLS